MRKPLWIVLLALVMALALVGTVLATHLPANHNTGVILARGVLADPINYNHNDVKIKTKAQVELVVQEVTFQPGASAGWHNHPGPVFVTLKPGSGTLTVWDPTCTRRTYSPGQSFFEPGPLSSLLVKNESATVVIVYATFIVEPGTSVFRFGTEHLCGIEE